MLSKDGEIRRDESCVDYAGTDVMVFPCHGMKGNQEWRYNHDVSFRGDDRNAELQTDSPRFAEIAHAAQGHSPYEASALQKICVKLA